MVPASPWPGADLCLVLDGALRAEGHLLSAGERVIVDRILGLPADALELYARLLTRQPRAFRVDELDYAGDVPALTTTLCHAELLTEAVPERLALAAFTVEALRQACVRLGMTRGGGRAELEARLTGQFWLNARVVWVCHRALVRRLEILYFQTPHQSRVDLVLNRLEVRRWVNYAPTGGHSLFRTRGAWLLWERARSGTWLPGDMQTVLARGKSEMPLNAWRYAAKAELLRVQALPAEAQPSALEGLAAIDPPLARLAWVRALEHAGQREAALSNCTPTGDAVVDYGLGRTAKRLARSIGLPYTPPTPLKQPPTRAIRATPGARRQHRPTWETAAGPKTVESAAIAWLAAAGRKARHTEQGPWQGLYAAVFADLYFLPIPGMLPNPLRAGPIDVGLPAFYTRRADRIEARLQEVANAGSFAYVERSRGYWLTGLYDVVGVEFLARAAPPELVVTVLGRLAREGWGVAPGLPDLFVAPGPRVRLESETPALSSIPAQLGDGAILVEVKGPGDTLRDEQRIWIDVLLRTGNAVELWEVSS